VLNIIFSSKLRLRSKWTFFQYEISVTQTHWFMKWRGKSQFHNKRIVCVWCALHWVHGDHHQHRTVVIGTAFYWHTHRNELLLVAYIPIAQPQGKILIHVPSVMCGKLSTVRQYLYKSNCFQFTGHYSFRSTSVRTPIPN